jgi:bifunctional NMN adenylyltransferase/nudix hydrolase
MANSTSPRKRLTVYIGRFQPFHLGHVHILEQAILSSDKVLVLVGSSHIARDIKNPFTFEERKQMISDWADNGNPTNLPIIKPLRDHPYNNAKWLQSVQKNVDKTIHELEWIPGEVDVTITGSDRDDSTWYLSSFPQYLTDLKESVPVGQDLSATKLRHKLFTLDQATASFDMGMTDIPGSTLIFLKKFTQTKHFVALKEEYDFNIKYKSPHAPLMNAIKAFIPTMLYEQLDKVFEYWLSKQYERTYVTADACIVQSGHVLVVRRGALPGKGLIALPGGFVKPHQTLQDTAVIEPIEETGLRLASGKNALKMTIAILRGCLRAVQNFDHPGRSLRGRTFTTCHLFRLDDTKPLPIVKGQFAPLEDTGGIPGIVETADAFWMPISYAIAHPELWFEDHHPMLETMLGLIKD